MSSVDCLKFSASTGEVNKCHGKSRVCIIVCPLVALIVYIL